MTLQEAAFRFAQNANLEVEEAYNILTGLISEEDLNNA